MFRSTAAGQCDRISTGVSCGSHADAVCGDAVTERDAAESEGKWRVENTGAERAKDEKEVKLVIKVGADDVGGS